VAGCVARVADVVIKAEIAALHSRHA
jgi:hypothetical protein